MAESTRRTFLKLSATSAAAASLAACTSPAVPNQRVSVELQAPTTAGADVSAPPAENSPSPSRRSSVPPAQRSLVVLQLSGGDDGLNMVVPYGDGLYYQLRPTLAIPQEQVLHFDARVGLHPNLKSLKTLYDQGSLALIQGVGYPSPNRSHFRSMEIWHTARPTGIAERGWLGSFMEEAYQAGGSPFQCVNFGVSVAQALKTDHVPIAALQDTSSFQFVVDRKMPYLRDPLLKAFRQTAVAPSHEVPTLELVAEGWDATTRGVDVLQQGAEKYQPTATYPNTPFGKTLQQVAGMLAAGVGTRIFYVQLGGFDTHANEKTQHANLMTQLGDGLAAFTKDLEGLGKAEQVVVAAFSEFGRRVRENGSGGTDHGAAGPMLVLGRGIKGGLYGEYPDLTNLDDGDVRFSVDFRSVYATLIEDWLGAPATSILGGTFDRLGFVA